MTTRAAVVTDRRFFMGMALVIAAVVFFGFAPTFYLRGWYHSEPLPSVFQIHGFVFTLWVVLFVTQTALVSARRTDLHRKLGVLGAVLAPLMLVLGYVAAITAARRGFTTPGLPPPLVFLAVPAMWDGRQTHPSRGPRRISFPGSFSWGELGGWSPPGC